VFKVHAQTYPHILWIVCQIYDEITWQACELGAIFNGLHGTISSITSLLSYSSLSIPAIVVL